jgi:hypothetical protein
VHRSQVCLNIWLLAVVPATDQVDLNKVRKLTKRYWRLARENQFGRVSATTGTQRFRR